MKCLRKCKEIGEVAVMDAASVGVRTRSRALALARRRTVSTDLRGRRTLTSVRISSDSAGYTTDRRRCTDPAVDSGCSRKEINSIVIERLGSEDLMVGFKIVGSDSKESVTEIAAFSALSPESGDMESTTKKSGKSSRRDSAVVMVPSMEEIEEFFSTAEEIEKKRFAEKYNFDVSKEVPLEGRYEWVRLK